MKHGVWITIVAAMLLSVGCASDMVARKARDVEFRPHPRIAVLPFENLSGQAQSGTKVTEYFQTLMAAGNTFETAEPGETMAILRKLRVRLASQLTTEQIQIISESLKVDYVLTGTVLEFKEMDDRYLGAVPQVSFSAHLLDCSTQKTVWAGVSNGSGDKGEVVFGVGAIRSADQLAREMVTNTVATLTGLFAK